MRIALTDSTMRLIQSCYTTAIGESWLKRSIEKFKKNYEFMSSFCKEYMSKLILSKPESGYCVVIDFKNFVIHDKEIIEIMDTAGLAAKKLDSYYEPGKKDVT
jgi:bifunctional pyridoxal-dependent enzyme with beta-cystathionase and maltose regulon repressor activities